MINTAGKNKGYTLVDFFTAMVIFTAVITTFFTLVGLKSDLLEDIENRTLAQNAISHQMEVFKSIGLPNNISKPLSFSILRPSAKGKMITKGELVGKAQFKRVSPSIVEVLVSVKWKNKKGQDVEEWALTYVPGGKP